MHEDGKAFKKTEKGHSYIEVDYDEITLKLGGMGICDSCSPLKEMQKGYLIPVLNSIICEECFDEWSSRAEYYEEDREYETKKTKCFLEALRS